MSRRTVDEINENTRKAVALVDSMPAATTQEMGQRDMILFLAGIESCRRLLDSLQHQKGFNEDPYSDVFIETAAGALVRPVEDAAHTLFLFHAENPDARTSH